MSNSYKRDPLIVSSGFYDPNLGKPDFPVEMDLLWQQYEALGDVECLARAAEIIPFFGKPEIGKAIAEILRYKEPSRKLEKELARREIALLYEVFVNKGIRKKDFYEKLVGYRSIEPDSMKRELMRRHKEKQFTKNLY
jgi:hypothetical protein